MSTRKERSGKGLDLDVGRLADLSRLSLSAAEAERLRGELSSILGYFATLDKVDVSKTNPYRAGSEERGLREDSVGPSIPGEILRGVPHKKGRYVRAPRVF